MVATKKPSWDQHMGHGARDVWGSFILASSLRVCSIFCPIARAVPLLIPSSQHNSFWRDNSVFMYFLEVFLASIAPCGIVVARHVGGGCGPHGAGGFRLDLEPLPIKYTGASILCAGLSHASAKWRAAQLSFAYSKACRHVLPTVPALPWCMQTHREAQEGVSWAYTSVGSS